MPAALWVLLYLSVGVVVQAIFELVWRHEKLPFYPKMWPLVLIGVLLWPFTLLSLLTWTLTAALRRFF